MSTTQVGSEILVSTTTFRAQDNATVIQLANGNFVVSWRDASGSDPFDRVDIRAQIFDPWGQRVGGEILANEVRADGLTVPAIAPLDGGGFVVTWTDTDTNTSMMRVRAQVFDSAGNESGDEIIINASSATSEFPSVTGLSGNAFVVSWIDNGALQVFAQRVDGAGELDGTVFQVGIAPVTYQAPTSATLADDNFVIAWRDEDGAALAQMFTENGHRLGGVIQVSSSEEALFPSIIALPNGGFAVAWLDQTGATSTRLQIYDSTGSSVLPGEIVINNGAVSAAPVDVAALGDEHVVVTWSSSTTGGDIHAQVFDLQGNEVGAEQIVNTTTPGRQFDVSATAMSGTRFMVTWTDTGAQGGDTSGNAVRAQILKLPTAATATDDTGFNGTEDTNLDIPVASLLANDVDIDGDKLTVTAIDYVGNDATVVLEDNGTPADPSDDFIAIDPDEDFNGALTFDYTIEDEDGNESTATAKVNFAPVNDAPTIDPLGTQYFDEDTVYIFKNGDFIVVNDPDSGAGEIQITLTAADGGLLSLTDKTGLTFVPNGTNNDGDNDPTLTFRGTVVDVDNALDGLALKMPENFTGPSTLKVEVDDLGNSGSGGAKTAASTVDIFVDPVNDGPPVSMDDAYTAIEDGILGVGLPGVLANDTDVDGDAMTAQLVRDVSNGRLTFSANGGFTYRPDANFHGTDSFTYKAYDGTAYGNTVTVTLTVDPENDGAPVSAADSYSVDEDTTLTIAGPGVLANDTDVDGDTLTAILVGDVSNGTLTLNKNGSFEYTPDAHFNGTDSFTYKANDGTADGNTVTVTLTVDPENDGVPVSAADSYSVDEDDILTIAGPGVLANDTDVDGDPLSAVLVGDVSNGTLTLNKNGSFEYIPDIDFSGTDSFTYKANDGTADGNTVTVTLTVDPENDGVPVSAADSYSVDEDDILTIAGPGVLANDTDVDGDPLSAVLVGDVSSGSLTLNKNGSFEYTPDANFNGTDSFTYKANDGTADGNTVTVILTVNPVNNGVPVSVADNYSVSEDDTLTVTGLGVLANDTDVDGDTLTAVLVGDVSNGTLALNEDGSFEYTPDANFNGTDSFTYKANDGTGDGNTVTVTLTVNPENDGVPVSVADSYTVSDGDTLTVAGPGVLANDTDADGDTLTAMLVGDVSNGTLALNEDGSFEYTPDADFSGTDSFTYKANDGTADGNTVTVTLTVDPDNDGVPVSVADGYSVDEDETLTIAGPGVLANDTDIDGDPLSAVLVGDVSNGTLALNKNGSFEYTPDANFNGTDSFTYKANDGTADGNTVTVALIVNPVNDAAVGSPTAILPDGTRDQAYIVPATDLLEGFSDPDGDPLSVTNLTVSGGTVVDNGDGTFTITLPAGTTGKIDLAYQVSDGKEAIDATQTFTVRGGDDEYNEPPSGADNTVTTPEDTTYIFAAADFGFSDEDGDSFAGVHLSTLPTNGLLLLDGKAVTAAQTIDATMIEAGRLTFMPAQDANGGGYASFTFQVLDDGGASGDLDPTPNTLTIDVTAVNDAPVAADDLYATNRDTPLTVAIPGLLANDSDADGDTLTALLVTGPANGTLTLNPDGSFTYTPAAGYVGADSFTYRASDGAEPQGNVATVRLNVTTGTGGGGNQPAAFTGEVLGRVIEAGSTSPGIPTATGSLVVTDPDGPDTVQPIIAGTRSVWGYGTVEMTRDGMWTYTLDNANPTVDRLVTGETLTDRFVALAADGTQQMVTITITGADDGRTITGTPEPDTLVGTSDDDIIRGLAGRDTLTGGAGDDSIDGGRGLDTAVFSGGLAGYRLTRIDERTVEIVDIDPSDGDDGTDILSSIEMLRFGNADPVTIGSLAGQPDWTLERDDVGVTAATYQLFLHGVPAAGGFDYLVMSDVNNTDLNDPYYFIFNLENRYLNFASNLGTASPEGAAWFDTEYGALSYEQAVEKAFAAIVSADALRAIGADPAVALDFFRDGQDFFEAVAAERVVRPGVDLTEATKIVMLGSMLYEAVKANVGSYGQAVNDFADIVYASGTHEDLGGNLFTVA